MVKCISCGVREAVSWDNLYCTQCLGVDALPEKWNLPQTSKKKNTWYRSKRATKVFSDTTEGYNVVEYHGCPVVKWNDDEIVLECCGWKSRTTKERMNQASREYDLDYYVYQKNYDWFVTYRDTTYPFDEDTITLSRKKEITYDGIFPDTWGVKKSWRPIPKYLDEL